jgi:hypothetical protein
MPRCRGCPSIEGTSVSAMIVAFLILVKITRSGSAHRRNVQKHAVAVAVFLLAKALFELGKKPPALFVHEGLTLQNLHCFGDKTDAFQTSLAERS